MKSKAQRASLKSIALTAKRFAAIRFNAERFCGTMFQIKTLNKQTATLPAFALRISRSFDSASRPRGRAAADPFRHGLERRPAALRHRTRLRVDESFRARFYVPAHLCGGWSTRVTSAARADTPPP
ncbi:MAG TPA: hypothetical protein PL143_00800 [Rhodocyclaceae bacterium]|nr:hypothetical protein [Rhodocyclaceae bacterium]